MSIETSDKFQESKKQETNKLEISFAMIFQFEFYLGFVSCYLIFL